MSIIGILLLSIIAWFFYNLFVKVVLPVYRTTNRLKQQFKTMAEQRQPSSPHSNTKEKPSKKAGEYIDFEEIK